MNRNIIPILLLTTFGCGEPEIAIVDQALRDIEELCGLLKVGMHTDDADKVMDGVPALRFKNTSGSNSGSGYFQYWNAPSDAEIIIKEPLRAVIPHGSTCIANYDTKNELDEIKFKFVSEDSYQDKVQKMNE